MATPLSLTEQQQEETNSVHNDEQRMISSPRPVSDEDLHTSKKQKVDHVIPTSSSQEPMAVSTLTNRIIDGNTKEATSTNTTSTPQPPPSPPLPITNVLQREESVIKSTHDNHLDPTAHSPETLEIISNEGTSPPPLSNGTGISPIQPKPRKQKSSRTSSPSPYSFGGMSTNMSRDQIRYCGAIMRNLKKHRDATPFIHPVDYIKLKVPDYPQIIKHPIDLTTIDGKLQHGEYNDVDQFVADIRLLFNNCYKFNGPEAMVSMLCQNVESAFEKSLRQMPPSKEMEARVNSHHSPQAATLSQATSFRRISEDTRPKREIHPPPSKDYPETMTKQRRGGDHQPSSFEIKRRKADVQLKFCGQSIRELKKNKYRDLNYPFLHPVDAVALNIPDYHTIITHPMDISTIERNLNNGEYDSPDSFESDVRLMFNNCYRYNPPALPIHKMAKELERVFDEKWKHLPEPAPPSPSPPPPPPPPPSSTTHHHHHHRSSVITRKADSYTSSNDEEDDISEESDNDRDDRIAELERHIANISQQIASIKSTKKKSDKSKSTKRKSISKSSTSKKTSSAKDTKPPSKPRRRPTTKQRPRKPSEPLPEFTFEQKKDLSESINNLSGDRLNTVVSIIQSSMSLDGEGQEEIVLDIDALDRKTLHRLHEFVTGKSLLRQPKRVNKKQKNMDSERRIRALEETLKQFNANRGKY
ncbi:Bromodomain-containing protein [Chlamydoabsidia padenii]|nr:Bromodomain-containing protein [Chlamydoabsidia padenii]